jgi:uroporphyrinogen-III synthase
MTLPLDGKQVLITRGSGEGKKLFDQVKKLGGTPFVIPLIDFKPQTGVKEAGFKKELFTYDWVIFTSKNGVRYFFEQVKNLPYHQKSLKFAVIGSKTREYLRKQFGIQADFMPSSFTARDFAAEFLTSCPAPGRVLIPKGNLANDFIAKSLLEKKIHVEEWIVYTTFLPEKSIERMKDALLSISFDFALFSSPSAFHHFIEVLEIIKADFPEGMEIVSIGPATTRAVEAYGYRASLTPTVHTMDEMIESLKEYILSGRNKQNE